MGLADPGYLEKTAVKQILAVETDKNITIIIVVVAC